MRVGGGGVGGAEFSHCHCAVGIGYGAGRQRQHLLQTALQLLVHGLDREGERKEDGELWRSMD